MREIACLLVVVAVAGAAMDGTAQGIDALERDVTRLVEDVSQSIVSVAAISGPHAARSVGCGIVFDEEGLILTTTSVVGNARQVEIARIIPGGTKLDGNQEVRVCSRTVHAVDSQQVTALLQQAE